MYFLLDNYTLLLQAVKGRDKYDQRIKQWKDWSNLTRNWFQLFNSIMKVRQTRRRLQQMKTDLTAYNDKVVGTTCLRATELVRMMINQKQKYYDHIFVLIRNTFRILMLNYKLGLPVWRQVFSPIVITEAGILMSISAIFKIWMKERHKNIHGRYVKMQDFIKTMPRVEQYV